MESEIGLIFQASTPKSKMKPYMILKSTETIAAQGAFPRRAKVLFRRNSHHIRYVIYVSGKDGQRDFEDDHLVQRSLPLSLWSESLLQLKEFRLVTAKIF